MWVTVPLASSDDVTDGAGSMLSPEFSDLEFAGTVVEVIVLPPPWVVIAGQRRLPRIPVKLRSLTFPS